MRLGVTAGGLAFAVMATASCSVDRSVLSLGPQLDAEIPPADVVAPPPPSDGGDPPDVRDARGPDADGPPDARVRDVEVDVPIRDAIVRDAFRPDTGGELCVEGVGPAPGQPLALWTFERDQDGVVRDESGVFPCASLREAGRDADIDFAGGAVRIGNGRLQASVEDSEAIGDVLLAAGSLTIEVWATADDNMPLDFSPSRIVTYSVNTMANRAWTLGQTERAFVVRLSTTATDDNGRVEGEELHVVDDVFGGDLGPHHLVLVFDQSTGESMVFVDGFEEQRILHPDPSGDPGTLRWNEAEGQQIAVGDELTGDRQWQGDVFRVAIFAEALSEETIAERFAAGRDDD